MGKNTIGYQNYIENVSRHARQKYNKIHPITPNVKDTMPKRQFDGLVKAWRRQLHVWDILPGQSAAHRVAIPTRKPTNKRQRMQVEKESTDSPIEENNMANSDGVVPEKSMFDDFDEL
jgi:hypothetical protein